MCEYGPRFFVGYKFPATCKKSEKSNIYFQKSLENTEMTGQTETHIS